MVNHGQMVIFSQLWSSLMVEHGQNMVDHRVIDRPFQIQEKLV